jgi:hypothetical protein
MADRSYAIRQRISSRRKSICEKCSHRRVCKAIDNQPCFECNQFDEEVVRCKDCVHSFVRYGENETYCGHPDGLNDRLRPDDFCSYGERREGE